MQALADLLTIAPGARRRSPAARSPTSATATTCAARWRWPPACSAWRCASPRPGGYGMRAGDLDRLARRGRRAAAHRPDPPRPWPAPTSSTPTCGRRWARRPRPSARRPAFEGFTVDDALMAAAAADAVFLHCLPGPPGRGGHRRGRSTARSAGLAAGRQPHARRPGPAGVARWTSRERAANRDVGHDAGRRQAGQDPAPAPHRPAARAARRARARPSSSSCWPPRASSPPRPRCRATSRTSAPSRCACPGGETRLRHPRAAQGAGRARGPPAPGARRLGGRGRPRPTSSCCAPRPARPTWSARPSTGPGCAGILGTVAGDDTADRGRRRGRRRRRRSAAQLGRPGRPVTAEPTDRDPSTDPDRARRRGTAAWRSEWCWPTAAASTPRWPCGG